MSTSSLFRVVWRWHFYAGLLVTPVLVVIAMTGGLYLFAAEINDAAHRQQLFVHAAAPAPGEAPETGNDDAQAPASGAAATQVTGSLGPRRQAVECQKLVAQAEAAVEGSHAVRIRSHADPQRNSIVWVLPALDASLQAAASQQGRTQREREISVFLDPYTGTVQHRLQGETSQQAFFQVVLKIHRQLFVGTTGRIVVELTSCWTIVLLLTGIYLWWPRRKEKLRGVWIPRWKGKPYTLLRDLHATTGIYLLPVCLVMILTGLFYTVLWGESFHLVSQPLFVSAVDEASSGVEPQDTAEEGYVRPSFPLQAAMNLARRRYPDRDVTIDLPSGASDHYAVSAMNDYARGTYGALDSTGFQIHRITGEILAIDDLSDNPRYWWHTWVYPLHVGSVWGPYTKIVWLAACLILIALPITGIWMWWKRRPAGRSGFPRKPPPGYVPAGVSLTIAALCVLLPLFGISILVILGGERLAAGLRNRSQSEIS